MNGYLKLYRKILGWEWYKDVPTRCLFIHLLITASFKKTVVEGITIPPGGRICTIKNLCDETGLERCQIRGAISKLEKTGELSSESFGKKYTLFVINNWQLYQVDAPDKAEVKAPSRKHSPKENKVPEIHRAHFGDDYEAYEKWRKEINDE